MYMYVCLFVCMSVYEYVRMLVCACINVVCVCVCVCMCVCVCVCVCVCACVLSDTTMCYQYKNVMWSLENKDTCIIHTFSRGPNCHLIIPRYLNNLDTFGWSQGVHNAQ